MLKFCNQMKVKSMFIDKPAWYFNAKNMALSCFNRRSLVNISHRNWIKKVYAIFKQTPWISANSLIKAVWPRAFNSNCWFLWDNYYFMENKWRDKMINIKSCVLRIAYCIRMKAMDVRQICGTIAEWWFQLEIFLKI